jgi:putative FmdB family regulatory protein
MFRLRPSSLSFVSMPTYDYRCPKGHDFEHFYRKISDATAELACPQCGAVAMRRMSAGAGLVFKGSGFYLTDYGKNAHRKGGTDGATPGGESKAETGSDAKPSGNSESAKGDAGAANAKADGASGSSTKSEAGKGSETKSSSAKSSGGDSK